MIPTRGFAAKTARAPVAPWTFNRRDPGPRDVQIEILYCGVCHSDIHQVRDEWSEGKFPMVPGHEIVGRVSKVGSAVTKLKVGEIAGVGCFTDSCRKCAPCVQGLEHYCEGHVAFTYNGTEMDEVTVTQGGYSERIVVDEAYALKVPAGIPLETVAPLLCAGITLYSPLKHWHVGPGTKLGIVGLGGLGHMGVKLGAAFGADVTVFSTSAKKEADARRLGARGFQVTSDAAAMEARKGKLDVIVDTVSGTHDVNALIECVRFEGSYVLVGVPEKPIELKPFSIIPKRRSVSGSMIGGIRETQEMLDFCGQRGIGSDVEVIPIQKINEAYERMIRGDVRYRFVIDMASLKA